MFKVVVDDETADVDEFVVFIIGLLGDDIFLGAV